MPANDVATWSQDEPGRIGAAEEAGLASRRPDGGLRPYVTMWVVRATTFIFSSSCRPTASATTSPAPGSTCRCGRLIGVITVLLPFIGYPRTLNALATVNEVAPVSKEGH